MLAKDKHGRFIPLFFERMVLGLLSSINFISEQTNTITMKGALNEDTMFMYCGIPLVFLGGMFHARG